MMPVKSTRRPTDADRRRPVGWKRPLRCSRRKGLAGSVDRAHRNSHACGPGRRAPWKAPYRNAVCPDVGPSPPPPRKVGGVEVMHHELRKPDALRTSGDADRRRDAVEAIRRLAPAERQVLADAGTAATQGPQATKAESTRPPLSLAGCPAEIARVRRSAGRSREAGKTGAAQVRRRAATPRHPAVAGRGRRQFSFSGGRRAPPVRSPRAQVARPVSAGCRPATAAASAAASPPPSRRTTGGALQKRPR